MEDGTWKQKLGCRSRRSVLILIFLLILISAQSQGVRPKDQCRGSYSESQNDRVARSPHPDRDEVNDGQRPQSPQKSLARHPRRSTVA
jgi:hypothetical protein